MKFRHSALSAIHRRTPGGSPGLGQESKMKLFIPCKIQISPFIGCLQSYFTDEAFNPIQNSYISISRVVYFAHLRHL